MNEYDSSKMADLLGAHGGYVFGCAAALWTASRGFGASDGLAHTTSPSSQGPWCTAADVRGLVRRGQLEQLLLTYASGFGL